MPGEEKLRGNLLGISVRNEKEIKLEREGDFGERIDGRETEREKKKNG